MEIDQFQWRELNTWNKSPILTRRACGLGLTPTHIPSFINCNPPTWSWYTMVRKLESVWGRIPNTFEAIVGFEHVGYLFSLRKQVFGKQFSRKYLHLMLPSSARISANLSAKHATLSAKYSSFDLHLIYI